VDSGTIAGRTGTVSGQSTGTIGPNGEFKGHSSYSGSDGLDGLHLEIFGTQADASSPELATFKYVFAP
jgi:hypothetical protein